MIEAGIVIDKAAPAEFSTARIEVRQAGHPIPDIRGAEAVREMLGLKNEYYTGKKDLILCLISGGGSALMPSPLASLSLNDKQRVTRLLLSCGADIFEINTIRKHLSRTKGGRLAQYFAPARVISLILSDVIGNDLSVIASGPTYPDQSTFEDAYAVLKKYCLLDKVPNSVLSVLKSGCTGKIEETPKSLDNVENFIIGDNRLALEATAEKAREFGFKPLIVSSVQKGRGIRARQRAKEILDKAYTGYDALLLGGRPRPHYLKIPAEEAEINTLQRLRLSCSKAFRRNGCLPQ
jgi:glycerate-2-kinase